MSDFKPGDKVKVEFDGVVGEYKDLDTLINISCNGKDFDVSLGFGLYVSPERLTLIKPAIKVGQKYKFFHGETLKIIEVGELVCAAEYANGKITALKIEDIDDRFELISEGGE